MDIFWRKVPPGKSAAYDDFYMKRFVAPILPWAMLSAGLSAIVLWVGIWRHDDPTFQTALINLGGGVLLGALGWLCYRFARQGATIAASLVVIAFGGTMGSIISWDVHEKVNPVVRAFPLCMIVVVIGAFFAPRFWILILGFIATMAPTAVLIHSLQLATPDNLRLYRSALTFTFATVLIFFLLSQRVKRAYFSLLMDHQELSQRDWLTGLYNRLGWYERGETAFREAGPHTPAAVLYLDLDHFKRVNDELGHAAGDGVLQQVAAGLTAQLTPHMLAARFGGEEFVLLVMASSHEQIQVLADDLRQSLEIRHILAEPITVSVGIAHRTDGESLSDIVLRADQALLRAKATGRNRVEIAASPHELSQPIELASAPERVPGNTLPFGAAPITATAGIGEPPGD